jgi:WD40 repeat protein/serine/threonine protein kinase
MNTCPPTELLERLLTGVLADADAAFVRTHVTGCAVCQAALDRLSDLPPLRQWGAARGDAALAEADRPRLAALLAGLADTPFRDALPAAEVPPPAAGATLGPYRLLGELGRGGMGVVYRAHDEALQRVVAVKVLLPGEADPAARARFVREARAAANVQHDHVVAVHAVADPPDGTPYLVMQYVAGPTLAAHVRARQRLDPREGAELCRQVALGLAAAHAAGLLHRDIKPANVILEPLPDGAGPRFRAKILDFGLARLKEGHGGLTRTGTVAGTPAYLSPEQLRDPGRIDERSDVYNLGVTLYEMLTGEAPFRGEVHRVLEQVLHDEPVPPRSLSDRIPPDLETVCLKAMAKEPSHRYPSARAFADDLARFLKREPVRARPLGPIGRLGRWCRRKPALAAASALALLATLATVVALAVVLRLTVQHAKEMEDKANTEAGLRKDAERKEARSSFEDSYGKCRPEEAGRGLLWLARSLQVAINNDAPDVEESVRVQLHGWSRYVHPLRAVLPHEDEVSALAFSPDGTTILTGSKDGTARLWDARTGEPRSPPLKHRYPVTSVAFSPDGQTALTGSGEVHDSGEARLWKTATGQEACPPLEHDDQVDAVAFSPDGRTVLTGSKDKAALWDGRTGKPVGRPLKQPGEVLSLAFSPDGQLILIASEGRDQTTAQLWDARTGERVGVPMKDVEDCPVAFSPDGKTFLTGRGRSIQLWETSTRKPIQPPPDKFGVVVAAFSPDGTKVVTGHDQNHKAARLWDVKTGRAIGQPLQHQHQVDAVAFSPDGRTVLTGSADRTARLWDAESGLPVGPPLQHQAVVRLVAFGPDGRTVLTAGADRTAQLWEVSTGKALGRPLAHGSGVGEVAFSPDGRTALTRVTAGFQFWDVRTREPVGMPLRDLPPPPNHPPNAAAFCADSQNVLVSYQGLAQRWEARTGKAVGPRLPHPGGSIAAFHPDGNTVLLRQDGARLQLWDLAAGKALAPPIPHTEVSINAAAFSPDGETLVILGGEARLWEARTGKEVRRLPHQGPVVAAAFSPDGRTLLTGSWDQTARLWDVATGKPVGPPLQHQDQVLAVALSPDGKTVLTGSMDRTARLWDVRTSKPLGPPLQHRGFVHSVAFSPDGKILLTGDIDGTKPNWEGAQFWEGPGAVAGEAERITLWVEVITGLGMDEHDVVQVLDAATWQERRRRLEELGGPPLP